MLHKTYISQDHYPFGMLMPTRTWDAESSYRFGFQGQERDDEIKGAGNSLNYTYRMHDPRLGRFFAVDPLTAKYPYYTPYQFSGNRLIDMIELEGLEGIPAGLCVGDYYWGKASIKNSNNENIVILYMVTLTDPNHNAARSVGLPIELPQTAKLNENTGYIEVDMTEVFFEQYKAEFSPSKQGEIYEQIVEKIIPVLVIIPNSEVEITGETIDFWPAEEDNPTIQEKEGPLKYTKRNLKQNDDNYSGNGNSTDLAYARGNRLKNAIIEKLPEKLKNVPVFKILTKANKENKERSATVVIKPKS